ncbi:tubulin polyglutamylase TTLL7 isoform X1 [Neopelma chrysocephalum]|uniref:tubulin polyglutamylase TTLL7 isoform X1 n=1 Tax=Neopelma chrysocephalum TaxID=114329 RepID=UPI000FCCEA63|nr:tubulin polyglutamylase TTLL7 isoform X1 [Neopelma chrysocephalum]XP_027538893.1 tubulin polyglutamylase TTLL7 isoform X1 [Neopelma chrysocephalum]XP_027538894.1 tubulin polyglutamylase TTLL7 isoform X1 [Neopelma chrysocephalum]XP_027538895.1 tubulin polyglutamylase TTLL7 isoform X1 [Neopelma chrysocephalum]XP_027538896.1 tubulin polyglutamylase TTLL7 isoform X1 [Neopelma chrysocephalum]XP_027538897.1 tubulin polyglutamylase TTLL7 isoform X1 [Neopelma chrysocephalum]
MPSFSNEGDNRGTDPLTLSSELPYQGTTKRKVRKKKNNGVITANIAGTKYEIVRIVIKEMGFKKTPDEDETANLIWSDCAVQQEKIAELRNYQRINHFPGMGEICRKDFLARNMTKMIKSQPQEYSFIPRTWIFPAEYTQFQNYVKELKKKRRQKTFIVKPANGAMGHGISLIRNGEKLQAQDHLIVQEYLDKPFLMEGYKFDLRVYILVTSCDPLKVFLYHDGLVRMGTEKYHPPSDSNLSQLYMHLTNYSVNKHNEHFERDETEDKGSKRSIKWFTEFLETNNLDVSKFWSDISELVVKTLIVAEPHVLHAYRMCRPGQAPGSDSVCFEVLGFDILLDRKLKPWLLEINRAPSFGTDQKIDYDVKKGVLLNALQLLNIRTSDKRRNLAQQKAEAQKRLYGQGSMRKLLPGSSDWEKQRHTLERRKEELKERLAQVRKQISKEEHENRHMGNYRRIYPPDDKTLLEKYDTLLATAFQTFLAGRAASLQREMNHPLKRMKEEDILDLLEQCEIDDEKLMGKCTRQRGPKPLCSMPESAHSLRKIKNHSSDSSCDSGSCVSDSGEETEKEDHNEKKEKKVSYDLEENKCKPLERSGRMNWKPSTKAAKPPSYSSPTSCPAPMRRSVSCPRSISVLTLQSQAEPRPCSAKAPLQLHRTSSVNRSHSLNRSPSSARGSHTATLGTGSSSGSFPSLKSVNRIGKTLRLCLPNKALKSESLLLQKTKEQEAALTKETLLLINDMRIKFPGKTDEESELIIEDIMDNWKYHKPKVSSYWMSKLDPVKQRKVLDIVRTGVRAVLEHVWKAPDVDSLHLYRLFNRLFSRLLWGRGQGLWNCFSNSGSSWETMFSKSPEVVTPEQLQCCQRIVQLCKRCLLVVYKYSADSRASPTGISHHWDDTRYLLPGPSLFVLKSSSSKRSCSSSGMPRPNILFTHRYSHL